MSRLRDGNRVNNRTSGKGEGKGRKDEELVHDRTPFSIGFTILQGGANGVTKITPMRILRGAFSLTTSRPAKGSIQFAVRLRSGGE